MPKHEGKNQLVKCRCLLVPVPVPFPVCVGASEREAGDMAGGQPSSRHLLGSHHSYSYPKVPDSLSRVEASFIRHALAFPCLFLTYFPYLHAGQPVAAGKGAVSVLGGSAAWVRHLARRH